MQDDTLQASVQYGDYHGTVAADWDDQRKLDALAEEHGIDTNKYFVYGMDIFVGESHGKEPAYTSISILAIETDVVGADVDSIQNYIDDNQAVLPYVTFEIDVRLEEVLPFFKRFNIVLKNNYIKRVNRYQLSNP